MLNLQVLIVDDEADVAEEIAHGLRHRTFKVLTATSGAEARELLESRSDIGVAVCDIRMPGLDGHALTRYIGALNTAGAAIEVILISGHATHNDEMLARDAGVFAFLGKPFLAGELRAALRRALARSLARRQGSGNAVNA